MTYPTKRNVSGIFFRCKRESGKGFENRCFEDLPEHEMDRKLSMAEPEFVQALAKRMAQVLHEVCEQFGIDKEGDDDE